MEHKHPCLGCAYRRDNGGSVHITCLADFDAIGKGLPTRKTWPGCGAFPLQFDAMTVFECPARSEDQEHLRANGNDPLVRLAVILGSAGR